jgi:sugar lactone lactonase YvrE
MPPASKCTATWKGVGLSTPESVRYDDATDTYIVSNVEGGPLDVDGKGFISKLGPDGSVVALKWIEGGKNKVTLNAPKGITFTADRLYVADIDTVRTFDRKTGAPKGDIKIPGATFLNDLTTAPDGRIIVSDTGIKAGAKGAFEPSGTDAVYAIDKERKVTTIAKSTELEGPNGLAVHANKIWAVTYRGNELYSLDPMGKKGDATKLSKGSLDGLVFIGDEALVSSWDASAIYRGKPLSELKVVIEDVKSPAGIGYDTKRSRLLVPLFNENEVRTYELSAR